MAKSGPASRRLETRQVIKFELVKLEMTEFPSRRVNPSSSDAYPPRLRIINQGIMAPDFCPMQDFAPGTVMAGDGFHPDLQEWRVGYRFKHGIRFEYWLS